MTSTQALSLHWSIVHWLR